MKCSKCNTENKDDAKKCRKCGNIIGVLPLWTPSWKWHAKVLTAVYVILIIVFFSLNHLLKPYLREIPKDVTPWLQEMPKGGDKVG